MILLVPASGCKEIWRHLGLRKFCVGCLKFRFIIYCWEPRTKAQFSAEVCAVQVLSSFLAVGLIVLVGHWLQRVMHLVASVEKALDHCLPYIEWSSISTWKRATYRACDPPRTMAQFCLAPPCWLGVSAWRTISYCAIIAAVVVARRSIDLYAAMDDARVVDVYWRMALSIVTAAA